MRSGNPASILPVWLTVLALGLAGCGGYDTTGTTPMNQPPPAANPSTDITIVQGAQTLTTGAFVPNPKVVALNGAPSVSVRFVNRDISGNDYTTGTAVVHHIVADDASFDTGNLGGNATATVNFSTTGDHPFHCANHPNMVGTVHVDP